MVTCRPAKADVAAKTGKQIEAPAPKTAPKAADQLPGATAPQDLISSDQKFAQMMCTVTASSDVGEIKVQLKPQNKRSHIAVLMFKEPEGSKLQQKLQIVIKPPEILGVDAMAILKDIAADVLDGDLGIKNVKLQRDRLLAFLEEGKLLDYFKEHRPMGEPSNDVFLAAYAKRVEMALELSSDRQPPPLDTDGIPDIDLSGEVHPDRNLAYLKMLPKPLSLINPCFKVLLFKINMNDPENQDPTLAFGIKSSTIPRVRSTLINGFWYI